MVAAALSKPVSHAPLITIDRSANTIKRKLRPYLVPRATGEGTGVFPKTAKSVTTMFNPIIVPF
jgi:hypothetical protein